MGGENIVHEAVASGQRPRVEYGVERPNTEFAQRGCRGTESFSIALSLCIHDLELGDGASGPGGIDVLGIECEQGIQRQGGERFPVQAGVDGNIGTAGADREKCWTVLGDNGGTISGGLLRGRLPGFRLVFGKSGDARTDSWILVVAADSGEAANARTRDGKNSG